MATVNRTPDIEIWIIKIYLKESKFIVWQFAFTVVILSTFIILALIFKAYLLGFFALMSSKKLLHHLGVFFRFKV